jgi:hypothetical protein
LINIFSRRGEFRKNIKDGLDERRLLVREVFLEESNNIDEFSLRLNETRRINLEVAEELESLVSSGNSFFVVLNSTSVSSILIVESRLSSLKIVIVLIKIVGLVFKVILVSLLFIFEIVLFVGVRLQIRFTRLNLRGEIILLFSAPASGTINFAVVVNRSVLRV